MDNSLSQQADRIFVEALDLDPVLRKQYLDYECAGNTRLRTEVESLLQASERAAVYFEGLPARLGISGLLEDVDTRARVPPALAGERFGSYTLVELIGSGGMGSVWRAERSDGQYEGSVAIKLLSRTHEEAALRRFRLEATYLAKLTHPNIARLLDAGVSDKDQPFLVLEYSAGMPIDRYCDQHRLSIEQRIRLFLHVLDAVAHAHAHLVVHRDLKPSNVLVTSAGTVKLLDFGIAKLLNAEAEIEQTGLTRQIGAALTPEFASPEQLQGNQVTTASDGYSLGLLLRLLLTGSTGRGPSTMESLEQLCAAAKTDPPSLLETFRATAGADAVRSAALAADRACSPSELNRQLTGDLNNIVQRACAVEPSERYATVTHLSSDLQRYLRHEPVSAQPPTVSYRARKFLRRHRGGVVAASLVGLALIAAGIVTVWQGLEAARQRDAAIQERARVQATNEFMTLLLEEVGPGGKPVTMTELLEQGLELLEAQHAAKQPYTAATYIQVAARFAVLGQSTRALELFERTREIARSENDLDVLAASHCGSAILKAQSVPEEAYAHLQDALEVLSTVREPSLHAQRECAQARARLLQVRGEWQQAIAILKDTVRLYDEAAAPPSSQKALLLNEISHAYYSRGMWDESLHYNDELLEMLERVGRSDTMLYFILTLNRVSVLYSIGEVLDANRIQENLLDRVQHMEEPMQRSFQWAYASGLAFLARHEESLQILETALPGEAAAGNQRSIAQIRYLIGANLVQLGRPDEALEHLEAAVAHFRQAPAAGRTILSNTLARQGFAYAARGEPDIGIDIISQALDEAEYQPGKATPPLNGLLRFGAMIELERGNLTRAAQWIDDLLAVSLESARDPMRSAHVGRALLLRSKLRFSTGEISAARQDAEKAAQALANSLGADHPDANAARALLDPLPRG